MKDIKLDDTLVDIEEQYKRILSSYFEMLSRPFLNLGTDLEK